MSHPIQRTKASVKPLKRRRTYSAGQGETHSAHIAEGALAARSHLNPEIKFLVENDIGALLEPQFITYEPKVGVGAYVQQVAAATPIQIVETERVGVQGTLIKDLSRHMDVSVTRFYDIVGVPKATAEKKASTGERVTGRGGQATLGMVRLLAIAQEIVANSKAKEAQGFDSAKWLGQWIERPQPSLGGRKPADLLDTPTGTDVVARLLGSIESGAYQ